MSGPPSGRPSNAPGRPFRPTRLGRWEVIAKIAGGGIATVYLAKPIDASETVAIKVLRDEHRTNDRVSRLFIDEATLLSRLVHPNIVRTLEAGVDEDAGCRFIAMELMLGVTLASVHDTAVQHNVRLTHDVVASIGAEVASALHYAHELRGDDGRPLAIIHRDVNPRNIFLCFDGTVKLFDFGMARSQGAAAMSSPGIIAGTLPYLSPEQVMQLPIDRRADIFALGTTIWELLTGRRLFRRDTDVETVRAVHVGPIPDPRTIVADVPEPLARIALRALERNREHRYATAQLLADDLTAFLRSRPRADQAPAVMASVLDRLFPGERKRQHGWLKPRIGPSIPPAAPSSKRTLKG